jgi:hypothetical protein
VIVKGQIVSHGEGASEGCLQCDINNLVNERLDGREKVDFVASVANLEEAGTWYYVVDCATCKAVIPFKHAPEDEPVVCFPTMRVRCLHCHTDHAYAADLISYCKTVAPRGIFTGDRPPTDAGGGDGEAFGGRQEDRRAEDSRERVILDREIDPVSSSLPCDNKLIVAVRGKRATIFFLSLSFCAAGSIFELALDILYPIPPAVFNELRSSVPATLLGNAYFGTLSLGLVLFILGMGNVFFATCRFKRKVDELVIRICSPTLAASRIAVPWTHIRRKERGD